MNSEQLQILEQRLRLDLEALSRVKRLMAEEDAESKKADVRQMPLALPVRSIPLQNATDDDLEDKGPTLRGAIEKVFSENPGVRLKNLKVLNHLQASGFQMKAKKPIFSVGQAVGKLVEKGVIKLIKKGEGNKPHIYQFAQQEPKQASKMDDPTSTS